MAEFRIENQASFTAALKRYQAEFTDLTIPLTQIGLDWLKQNTTFFNKSGAGSFADLSGGREGRNAKSGRFQSPNGGYKAQKLKKWGFIYPILRASGALERSITELGAPGQVFNIAGGNRINLGTSVTGKGGAPYPKFLNDGTRNMPARKFMGISEVTAARWKSFLEKYAGQVLRK